METCFIGTHTSFSYIYIHIYELDYHEWKHRLDTMINCNCEPLVLLKTTKHIKIRKDICKTSVT